MKRTDGITLRAVFLISPFNFRPELVVRSGSVSHTCSGFQEMTVGQLAREIGEYAERCDLQAIANKSYPACRAYRYRRSARCKSSGKLLPRFRASLEHARWSHRDLPHQSVTIRMFARSLYVPKIEFAIKDRTMKVQISRN